MKLSLMRWGVFVLPLFLMACDDRGGGSSATSAKTMPGAAVRVGMKDFKYLACDGGPHMLLPAGVASSWAGASSMAAAVDPRSDYGRACAATTTAKMALISVGSGNALVLGGPPMTAWGKASDGLVEVYYLESWKSMDLDGLIHKATAAISTASMKDSGGRLRLDSADAFLLFAGDTVAKFAYQVHRVPLAEGVYKVLEGRYAGTDGVVTVYRLEPVGM